MLTKKPKTFNAQVYNMVCKRLKLKRREKFILFRLLGFLIRNDLPFPYSIDKLAEINGYSRSSIFECLNLLEKLRLIERIGYTNRLRYQKGRILKRICTLVQKRINIALIKNSTLVQKLDELVPTSPVSGYNRTYSFLEHKEKGFFSQENIQQREWYLKNPDINVSKEDKWLFDDNEKGMDNKYLKRDYLKSKGVPFIK